MWAFPSRNLWIGMGWNQWFFSHDSSLSFFSWTCSSFRNVSVSVLLFNTMASTGKDVRHIKFLFFTDKQMETICFKWLNKSETGDRRIQICDSEIISPKLQYLFSLTMWKYACFLASRIPRCLVRIPREEREPLLLIEGHQLFKWRTRGYPN